MNLKFDFNNIKLTEFGVGKDIDSKENFEIVPVDLEVQMALKELAESTLQAMHKISSEPALYDPSEKYGSVEFLYLPLVSDLSSGLNELKTAVNLDVNITALSNPDHIFCYFARFQDNQGQTLTALRRASQFKGVVKSRNRLVRLINDSLEIIPDVVFKLDNDFDLLIDDTHVFIFRPSGFESAGKLQQAILDAVSGNIGIIRNKLTFVDFDNIEQYSTTRIRAARYIASICGQDSLDHINKAALKSLCKNTGVELIDTDDGFVISDGNEMEFLQVLDRRRYRIDLIVDQPESYVAASRKRAQ